MLSDHDAERLLLLSAPLQDLSAAGFIPHLLGTEEISHVSVRQIWAVIPGVDLRYASELLKTIFETLGLYQKVDNRVLEFVLQAYSATPPSFLDLQRLYQQLQK